MKIAILVYRLTGGGAERVASLWATGFAGRGYDVSVIVGSDTKKDITYNIPDNVQLYSVGSDIRPLFLRNAIGKLGWLHASKMHKLKRILHEINPDVIIGVLHPWAWEAYHVTKGMNIPIINTEHNSFERPASAPLSKQQIIEKFEWNKYFDHVTVLTEADKMVIGNQLNNVSVLPNPLTFEPLSFVPNKDKIILASGRLDAWYCKGFDILIKAWGKIANKYPEWKLAIVGTGKKTSLSYLKSLSIQENISSSQIDFLGFTNDIKSLYERSSIFVLSSRYEGFGMVLTEAMSQGCACIACDYKGRQREIIVNDSQGLICPVEDVDALAVAVERMITDKKYREECQSNAIERSKFYIIEKTMNRWEEMLKTIIIKERIKYKI